MESILTSEPLWTQEEYILQPTDDIKHLRAEILAILLDGKQFNSAPDDIDGKFELDRRSQWTDRCQK